jgi:putative transposase
MVHRKTVRHFHEVGHLHELTFSCYRRMPLLTNDSWREKLSRCVEAAGKETAMQLVGFVFMPEHVHLLVFPTVTEPSISRYLARIKQPFSKQIKDTLVERRSPLLPILTVLERPGKTCFRFWQEGPGFDRNLFSSDAISSSLSTFTTTLSAESFVGMPWTGNGRRPNTTLMCRHDSRIRICR